MSFKSSANLWTPCISYVISPGKSRVWRLRESVTSWTTAFVCAVLRGERVSWQITIGTSTSIHLHTYADAKCPCLRTVIFRLASVLKKTISLIRERKRTNYIWEYPCEVIYLFFIMITLQVPQFVEKNILLKSQYKLILLVHRSCNINFSSSSS
jgi:hypothetical protein